MHRICQIEIDPSPSDGRGDAGPPPPELRFRAPDGTFWMAAQEFAALRERDVGARLVREVGEHEVPVRFLLPHDGAVCNPPPANARLAVLARLLSEERADADICVRFLGRNRSIPSDGFELDVAGGKRRYAWQVVPSEEVAGKANLRERFAALRALCATPDTRVVLALGSGGLKLFSHAPALRLLEAIGCAPHVDEVWGSSAGAMAGLLYSQGLSPQAIEQMGYDLYAGRVALDLRPSKMQFLRHLLRDAFLPGEGAASAGFVDFSHSLSTLLDAYGASGPARRPLYCVAFNLAACRADVLTPEPVPDHLGNFARHTDGREAALASSTVPLLFVPRVIAHGDEAVHYIDGSTTEDVPIFSAVRKWDLDRQAGVEAREHLVVLYVKLTGTLDRYRTRAGRIGKLHLLQTVAAAGIETMFQRDRQLLGDRPDVHLLGLELRDESPDFFERSRIPDYVRAAKESFPDQLTDIEARLRRVLGPCTGP